MWETHKSPECNQRSADCAKCRVIVWRVSSLYLLLPLINNARQPNIYSLSANGLVAVNGDSDLCAGLQQFERGRRDLQRHVANLVPAFRGGFDSVHVNFDILIVVGKKHKMAGYREVWHRDL